MNKPWDIVAELEADNSRLAKDAIIKREVSANNAEFFRGFRAACDCMITFGIKKVETKTGDGKGLNPQIFWDTAEKLSRRELTGNAAVTAVAHMRMNAKEAEWNQWYRRILVKDMKCGVSETSINKFAPAEYQIPIFTCQLAYDGAKHESKVAGSKFIEVKLDGVRVITIVYPNGQVDQYSRNGKELVNFEHIKKQFSKHAVFLSEPMVFDGEVMSSSFQDLMKQVHRKSNVEANDAVLHLFDMLPLSEFQNGKSTRNQTDRSALLKGWFSLYEAHMPNIAVVEQELVDLDTTEGSARFTEINKAAIDGGYEGIMIKDPKTVYECDRTVAWLKIKPFIEVTLAVVDVEEGTGKNENNTGALVCEGTDDGKFIRVNVGGGLTDKMRAAIWADIPAVKGQLVEVRADAVTQNQDGSYSLRFPRFLRFRGFAPGEKL
jgi:DNA ligase-1